MGFTLKFDDAVGLCGACKFGAVRTTHRDTFVECAHYGPQREPITQCSTFEDKNSLSMFQMEKMAWDIEPAAKGGPAGFRKDDE